MESKPVLIDHEEAAKVEWERFVKWFNKTIDLPLWDTKDCKFYVQRAVEYAIRYARDLPPYTTAPARCVKCRHDGKWSINNDGICDFNLTKGRRYNPCGCNCEFTAPADATVTVSASGVDPSLPTHCDHGVSLDNPCSVCRTAPAAQPVELPCDEMPKLMTTEEWESLSARSRFLINEYFARTAQPAPTTEAREGIKKIVNSWLPDDDVAKQPLIESLTKLFDAAALLFTPGVGDAIILVEQKRDRWAALADEYYEKHGSTYVNGKRDAANEILEALQPSTPSEQKGE